MHPTPVLAATPAEAIASQPTHTQPQLPQDAQSSTSGTTTQSTTTQPEAEGQEQYLLVLSGLIGSGKSTFARALVEHFPTWRRCNQDELGDRHAVVYAARTALLAGHNVVIDRTNIDAKQRRTWLDLARDVYAPPSTAVESSASADVLKEEEADKAKPRKVVTISLTLTISVQAAEDRLRVRVAHETIKSPEEALGILPHFLRTYQKPTTEEGFNYVFTYPAGKLSREPSKQEIRAILFDTLAAEARANGVLPDRPPPRSGGAGRGRGGGRGRGRGRGEWRGRARGASAVYTPHHQHQHQPYPQQQQRQPTMPDQAAPTRLGSTEGEQGATPSFAAAAASLPPPPPPSQPETLLQLQP